MRSAITPGVRRPSLLPNKARIVCRDLSRLVPVLTLLGTLAACTMPNFLSFPPQVRGNKVDASQLKQLVPGTSTRADVTSLIGSPTARATFDDNTWIYIGMVTRPVIAGTNNVLNQEVVMLTFDSGGVLRHVDKRTQADSEPVDIVSRTTPAPGNNASIMQQLLGNVGRFSPTPLSGGNAIDRSGGSQGNNLGF
jgi:outer membrane protein assembly factor BamE (lipoprotein component of BamABCDE complex)